MAEVEGEIKEKKKNALKVIGLVKGDHFGGGGGGWEKKKKNDLLILTCVVF